MDEKRKKKKPNKQQRDKQRAHDADTFNRGFIMGYEMAMQEAAKAAHKESLKWAHRGS